MEITAWRTEVWHPLTVHFPVALLLVATIAKVVALFLKPANAVFWNRMGAYLLYVGCAGAWLSIYTGDLADGAVARKLCDPTILKDHEIAAYNMAYLFSGAVLLDLTLSLKLIQFQLKAFALLVVTLMLVGSGFLVYVGHLGANLVYEQGGGVNIPASNCAGF